MEQSYEQHQDDPFEDAFIDYVRAQTPGLTIPGLIVQWRLALTALGYFNVAILASPLA